MLSVSGWEMMHPPNCPPCGSQERVRFNAPGCHYLFDQHQLFPRAERAAVEQQWGAETRAAILAAGLWPKNLPEWTPCAD